MQIAAWSEQRKSRRRNKGHVSAAQDRWHAHGSRLIQSHAEAMRRQMGGVEERALECLGHLVAAWGKEAMGLVSWAARRGQLNAQGRTTCVVQGRGRQAGRQARQDDLHKTGSQVCYRRTGPRTDVLSRPGGNAAHVADDEWA
jgi:hypothetical protein